MTDMDQHEPSDADLVAEALAGDREAFGRLYDRHAKKVRAVVVAVSADWPAVEDMTQECFLRGYRKLDTLREPQQFGRWIVGVARQVARERKRTLRRDRHRWVADSLAESEPTADGATRVQDTEQLQLLMRSVAELPQRERLAIHAFFFEEQNARRAAELLEMSRSGFYALLNRALARLAGLMQTRQADEEAKR
jgi:RNA polymerase sigma-70 factor (ECF subfamily)